MTPAAIQRESAKARREALEELLALHLRADGIQAERQVEFWPGRKWRFDFCFRPQMLAVEVQGGTWSNGAHARGSGIEKDTEKLAHAAIAGWRVITVTGDQVRAGLAVRWIKAAIGVTACDAKPATAV